MLPRASASCVGPFYKLGLPFCASSIISVSIIDKKIELPVTAADFTILKVIQPLWDILNDTVIVPDALKYTRGTQETWSRTRSGIASCGRPNEDTSQFTWKIRSDAMHDLPTVATLWKPLVPILTSSERRYHIYGRTLWTIPSRTFLVSFIYSHNYVSRYHPRYNIQMTDVSRGVSVV